MGTYKKSEHQKVFATFSRNGLSNLMIKVLSLLKDLVANMYLNAIHIQKVLEQFKLFLPRGSGLERPIQRF